MKKKPILVIAAVALLIALSGGGFYVYKQRQPHYVIAAVEETLRESDMISSEFKIKEAKYLFNNGGGFVLVGFSYQNEYGAQQLGKVALIFKGEKINTNPKTPVERFHLEMFKEDQKAVADGTKNIDPFSKLRLSRAEFNNEPFSSVDMLLLQSNLRLRSLEYKGPSLKGRISKLSEDGNHSYDAPVVIYNPEKLFPYTYKQ